MTTVIAHRDTTTADGTIVLGADGQSLCGMDILSLVEDKWVTKGQSAIGFEGCFTQEICESVLKPFRPGNGRMLAVQLREAVQGSTLVPDREGKGAFPFYHGEWLCICRGEIVYLCGDLTITPRKEPFVAIGSGCVAATAVLKALTASASPLSTEERVRLALQIASECDSGTGGKLSVQRLGGA